MSSDRIEQETNTDIDDRKKAEALLAGENKILEMVATGKPLATVMHELCCLVDSISTDSMASVLLVDSNNCLRVGAAPRFPKDFMSLVDGIKTGPMVGSCGTAAYRKEQVIVTDMETDPLWEDYRELARQHGLRAGWSTPVLSSDRSVLGVFGIYWGNPRTPTPAQYRLIDQITHLASVAIERQRSQEAIRASERFARGQAEVLTRTLDELTRESDFDRIAEHVLRALTSQLDACSSGVWLMNGTTGLMDFEFALERGLLRSKSDAMLAAINPSLLAQGLTGVIVQLEAAGEAMGQSQPTKASGHLERASQLARESLQEARRSVRALRPQALEENSLSIALNELLAKMTADTPITAKLTVDGEPRLLPQEWENNLFRIGQEVLTNALRHAQATEFCGRLSFGGREVSLHLRDNGIGFDPEGLHEGYGLQGIRERAETMAGKLAIQSEKGRGVSISIVLPVDPRGTKL